MDDKMTDKTDLAHGELHPFRVIRDNQTDCSNWRNIVVVGPGLRVHDRRYWITFNNKSDRYRENDCLVYLRQINKGITRRLAAWIRKNPAPAFHSDY